MTTNPYNQLDLRHDPIGGVVEQIVGVDVGETGDRESAVHTADVYLPACVHAVRAVRLSRRPQELLQVLSENHYSNTVYNFIKSDLSQSGLTREFGLNNLTNFVCPTKSFSTAVS